MCFPQLERWDVTTRSWRLADSPIDWPSAATPRLGRLRPATYRVLVRGQGGARVSEPLVVQAGVELPVTVALKPGRGLKGRVLDATGKLETGWIAFGGLPPERGDGDNKGGTFLLENVPDEEFVLAVYGAGTEPRRTFVLVPAGTGETVLEVTLP